MFGSNNVADREIYNFIFVIYWMDEHAKFIKKDLVQKIGANTLQLKADAA